MIKRAIVSHQRRTLDFGVGTFSIVEILCFWFTNIVLFVGWCKVSVLIKSSFQEQTIYLYLRNSL